MSQSMDQGDIKRVFQQELKQLLRDLFPNFNSDYFNKLMKSMDEEHKN